MEEVIEKELILDSRRNHYADRKKLYEEMLLKEIPGTSRPNEPMHAVLEGELGSSEMIAGHEAQNVRNHALIHYLATLANSNKTDDTFDFDFVESLLKNGADVNSTDKTGQTVFHEVARSWNVDVACFLIKNGANVNHQDQFGRSPLHVAAAVDYPEMVEFLVKNGADVDIQTYGEQQAPIHFAAKNDAINSLQMLLGYGADIDARDGKNRTPLQVSAEMNRCKAAKLLVSEGAPAGVYDNSGNSALSLLIEKIPDVALEALDQFHSTDTVNRKEYYFLNYLERAKLEDHKTPARTPLEIAVQNERFDIILHPVMQRLVSVKWQIYGKWGAVQDLVLNLLYAILWSVMGVTIPRNGRDLYTPLQGRVWRLAIGAVIILLTLVEVKKQIKNTIKTRRELKKWREWRAAELERDIQYCHPRWPQETHYLQSEIKAVRNMSLISASDSWIYFDWVALVFILATITSHVIFFHYSTDTLKEIHHHIIIVLLLILWFRILKYARPFEGAGPFVVIFGSVMGDIVKWGFLNSVIVVPYTCAFWITFGTISLHPVKGYDAIGPLFYNMFSMMVVNPHDYDLLEKANPVLARLLTGSFISIVAIVTLNLLIALLSNTFERLYENAIANAVMQRARTILLLQKSLRKKQMNGYYNFITKSGSPEVIENNTRQLFSTIHDDRVTIERVCDDVRIVKNILGERFGRRYGKEKKSDLDFVKADLGKVKRLQEKVAFDMRDMKITLQKLIEMNGQTIEDNNTSNIGGKANNSNNTNDGEDNTNDMDNKRGVTSINNHRSSSSTTVNVPPSTRFGSNNKADTREHKVRQKFEQNSDDDLETDNSSVDFGTLQYSEDIDGERKQNKKGQRTHECGDAQQRNKKKSGPSRGHKTADCGDDISMTGNRKQVHCLLTPTKRERTSQRFSSEMTKNIPDCVHQQSTYPPECSQPLLQDLWENDGMIGMGSRAQSPKSTQPQPRFIVFPPSHDPRNRSVLRRYLMPKSSQLKPHFNNWSAVLPLEQTKFMPKNPQQHYFTSSNGLGMDRYDDHRFENRKVMADFNDQPSLNDMQYLRQQNYFTERTRENGRSVDNRIYQPVFLSRENAMIYPSPDWNFPKSVEVQNTRRPKELHSHIFREDGRDGQPLNKFPRHGYPSEYPLQGPNDSLNDRWEPGMRELGPFRSPASGESHYAFHEIAQNGTFYVPETIRQTPHQSCIIPPDSIQSTGHQNFCYTQHDKQSQFPQSATLRLTETRQQNALSQERVSLPDPQYQMKDVRRTHDGDHEMMSVNTPVRCVPTRTQLEDPAKILKLEDGTDSGNQIAVSFPNSKELSESQRSDVDFAQSSKRTLTPISKQTQSAVDNIAEEAETGQINPPKGATPLGPTIIGKVVYFEKKIGEAETTKRRGEVSIRQDRGRRDDQLIPDTSQKHLTPLSEMQDKDGEEARDKHSTGI